jgi:hypothetical protein
MLTSAKGLSTGSDVLSASLDLQRRFANAKAHYVLVEKPRAVQIQSSEPREACYRLQAFKRQQHAVEREGLEAGRARQQTKSLVVDLAVVENETGQLRQRSQPGKSESFNLGPVE